MDQQTVWQETPAAACDEYTERGRARTAGNSNAARVPTGSVTTASWPTASWPTASGCTCTVWRPIGWFVYARWWPIRRRRIRPATCRPRPWLANDGSVPSTGDGRLILWAGGMGRGGRHVWSRRPRRSWSACVGHGCASAAAGRFCITTRPCPRRWGVLLPTWAARAG